MVLGENPLDGSEVVLLVASSRPGAGAGRLSGLLTAGGLGELVPGMLSRHGIGGPF